jgi:hypothetical protein
MLAAITVYRDSFVPRNNPVAAKSLMSPPPTLFSFNMAAAKNGTAAISIPNIQDKRGVMPQIILITAIAAIKIGTQL